MQAVKKVKLIEINFQLILCQIIFSKKENKGAKKPLFITQPLKKNLVAYPCIFEHSAFLRFLFEKKTYLQKAPTSTQHIDGT